MTKPFTSKQIIKKIGHKNLNLYRGEGYWYFVYDNATDVFESKMIYCMYLNQMSFARWVDAGIDFVKEVENKR